MSQTNSAHTQSSAGTDERTPNTLLNGVIGGIAAVLLSFIPLSPVIGGGIAGYLEGGDQRDGLVVGAIAGGVALLPLVAFGMIAAALVIAPGGLRMLPVLVVVLLLGAFYTVGLAALGGIAGNYAKREL